MFIAIAPYIGMKFGHLSLLVLAPFILYFTFNTYTFYKNISFPEALEDDLPNMSPIHFVFFILIAAPIFLLITGGNIEGLVGIAIIWTIYTIYYYGFRKK